MCNPSQLCFIRVSFKAPQVKKFVQPFNTAPQLPAGAGKHQKIIHVSCIKGSFLRIKIAVNVVQQAAANQRLSAQPRQMPLGGV